MPAPVPITVWCLAPDMRAVLDALTLGSIAPATRALARLARLAPIEEGGPRRPIARLRAAAGGPLGAESHAAATPRRGMPRS